MAQELGIVQNAGKASSERRAISPAWKSVFFGKLKSFQTWLYHTRR